MKLMYPSATDPIDPIKSVNLVIETVEDTDEWDYGDCMRIWNHDLLYLKDHLKNSTPWARAKLDEIQFYVQFEPNWDVPSTKEKLLRDLGALREHLSLNENAGRAA